jgi:NAD(P)H-dependent FMN reductase
MKLLAFAASLRADSLNRRLLRQAVSIARDRGAEVQEVPFQEFACPYFDGDYQDTLGIPEGAQRLSAALARADGLLLASPEYNFSLPGTLKNTIDWTSRIRPVPFRSRTGLLLAASNGPFGGVRGLWQLRIPLEGLGMALYPDMYALPSGKEAFTAEGDLADAARRKRLEGLIEAYLKFGAALAAVPG